MSKVQYTFSCIIHNQNGECLSDNGWTSDCRQAVLFSPAQAEKTILNLSEKFRHGFSLLYVIQNAEFDYENGHAQWVPSIADAKFYSAKEAESRLKQLAKK